MYRKTRCFISYLSGKETQANQCATGYPVPVPVPVPANPVNIFQSGSGQILLFWPDSSQIDKYPLVKKNAQFQSKNVNIFSS